MTDSTRRARKLLLINAGGTIATHSADPLNFVDYPFNSQRLAAAEVIEGLLSEAGSNTPYAFSGLDVYTGSSLAVGPSTWQSLRTVLLAEIADRKPLDGIVVTHGTSTLEETAFFLALTVPTPVPVVIAGSQRPHGVLGSDAALSLHLAALAACQLAVAEWGVVVQAGDKLLSPWGLTKIANYLPVAFAVSYGGPIAIVGANTGVRICGVPPSIELAAPFRGAPTTALPDVKAVASFAGSDGELIRAAVRSGAAGLAIEGAPPGMVTPPEMEALRWAISEGTPVAIASRAHADASPAPSRVEPEGAVFLSSLSVRQGRILLMTALAAGWPIDRLQAYVREHGL